MPCSAQWLLAQTGNGACEMPRRERINYLSIPVSDKLLQIPSSPDARDPSEAMLIAKALTTAGIGVWQWNPESNEEAADAGLEAIMEGAGAPSAHSLRPILANRLSPRDRERLQLAAALSVRDGHPFDLVFDLENAGDLRRKIRIRGGISPQDRQVIVAVCHLIAEPESTSPAPATSIATCIKIDSDAPRRGDPKPAGKNNAAVALMNGIAVIGTDGLIRYVNQMFLHMWRYDHEDEVLGRHAAELWWQREKFAEILGTLFQKNEWAGDFIAARRDGTQFEAELTAIPIQDNHGQPSHLIGAFIDAAEWRSHRHYRQAKSEARLSEAQRIAKIGNWEMDCPRNRLIWSDELFRIFEVDPGSWSVTLENFLTIVHADDRSAVSKAYEASLRHRNSYEITHRACMPDGRVKWIHERCTSTFDADGRPLRSVGTAQDVTLQKEAEIALLAAYKRLRDILDSLYGFVGLCEIDGTLIETNRGPLEAAELSREEVLGRPFWESYWWSYSGEVQARLRDALRRAAMGEIVRFEVPVRVRDDTLITIDVMFGPLRGIDGQIVNILVFAVDITERKRLEELLRQSEKSIRLTLDAIPAQVAVLDDCGVIILTNQAWKDFATRAGLDWRKVSDGVNYLLVCERAIGQGAEQAKQVAGGIRGVIAGKIEEFLVKYDCFTPEGRRWFLCRVKRFFDGGRECVIVVHADITAVEEAEMQLEEMRSQLAHAGRVATMGEMAAGIAHELNQPLAAISLYAEGCLYSIKKDSLSPEMLHSKLQEIAGLAGRCGKIIRGLREFVTRQPTARSTIDVREVIQASLAIVEHECGRAGLPFRVELPDEPLWINGNAVQIQQVLFNLVRNAIEAQQGSPLKSRQVIISAQRSGTDKIKIAVKDYGFGIPEDTIPHLFEPFFTTKKSGMGMGLKISQSIVEAHGGSIAYRADAGGGMTFMVYLPGTGESHQ